MRDTFFSKEMPSQTLQTYTNISSNPKSVNLVNKYNRDVYLFHPRTCLANVGSATVNHVYSTIGDIEKFILHILDKDDLLAFIKTNKRSKYKSGRGISFIENDTKLNIEKTEHEFRLTIDLETKQFKFGIISDIKKEVIDKTIF